MFSCVYLYAMSPSPYKMGVVCIMCAVEQSPPGSKVLCTHEAQEGLYEKEKQKEVLQLLPFYYYYLVCVFCKDPLLWLNSS